MCQTQQPSWQTLIIIYLSIWLGHFQGRAKQHGSAMPLLTQISENFWEFFPLGKTFWETSALFCDTCNRMWQLIIQSQSSNMISTSTPQIFLEICSQTWQKEEYRTYGCQNWPKSNFWYHNILFWSMNDRRIAEKLWIYQVLLEILINNRGNKR